MRESQKLSIIKACETTCTKCGQPCEGVISAFSGKPVPIMCEECEVKRHREQREREERRERERQQQEELRINEHIAKLDWILGWLKVAKRYVGCTLESFEGEVPEKAPCFITGPVGTGKTHLAAGYFRRQILATIQRGGFPSSEWGQFIRAVDLFRKIRDCFRENSEETESGLIEIFGSCDLLVLDDLGTEKVSDFVEQTLYDIIDHRYSENLPIIITSNLSISEIAAHYKNHGERLASRICGMGEIYAINAKDRRLKRP